MSFFSPIHHTFAPHVDLAYLLRTLALFFQPWKWRTGPETERLRAEISKRFSADTFLFSSGREALLALLNALHLKRGEEVIVQTYTCIVVPNAINAAEGVPVYADIDEETLNLNLEDTENHISNETRAIICQHTFGIPSDTDALLSLCEQYDIILIEDCAHTIPESIESQFAFFSFGRDKAISGITGGAVISRNSDISAKLKELEEAAQSLSLFHIKRLLFYPLIYAFARPLYGLGIGKMMLKCVQILGLLIPIVSRVEKEGSMDPTLHKLPNACALLALFDWNRLRAKNDHRRKLTKYYLEEAQKKGWNYPSTITENMSLQKFPLFVKGADEIRRTLKRKNIHLDDGWTGCAIVEPDNTISSRILNLPTHPTMTVKQGKKLAKILSRIL